MRLRIHAALLVCALILPGFASAQTIPGDVTFEVPLNLTRLAPEITQIDITCYITGKGIPNPRAGARGAPSEGRFIGSTRLDVVRGRLVTRADVVVPVQTADYSALTGQTANYQCMITAYSAGIRAVRGSTGSPAGWGFLDANSTNPAFRFSPTPQPITSSFVW